MLEKHREKMGASVSSGKTDVGGLRGRPRSTGSS